MNKFKVGDRVRITTDNEPSSGATGTVTAVKEFGHLRYTVKFDTPIIWSKTSYDHSYFSEDELEAA